MADYSICCSPDYIRLVDIAYNAKNRPEYFVQSMALDAAVDYGGCVSSFHFYATLSNFKIK